MWEPAYFSHSPPQNKYKSYRNVRMIYITHLLIPFYIFIPSRYPIMAIRPFHRVYPPGTPSWPSGRFTEYTLRAPHHGHPAVSQGIPSGHPIMAIRPFHRVYLEGINLWNIIRLLDNE